MRKIPVYLARRSYQCRSGYRMSLAECRLVRKNSADELLAVIRAPFGSRVRLGRRGDGPDELVVRRSPWPWMWFFGGSVAIPAKYLVEDARHRAYGLSLAADRPRASA